MIDILALTSASPSDIATEALYYCLRALKQAGLPQESKKDYFYDTGSSAPSETAIALAKSILEKISDAEHAELDQIDRNKIDFYISNVAQASNAIAEQAQGFNRARGTKLLEKMRSLREA